MKENRKELIRQYKERKVVGCVFVVRNTQNGRYYLNYSDVAPAAKNTFDMSVQTGGDYKPCMRNDWRQYGAQSFIFEVLEELEKKDTQSSAEFTADLKTLTDLWAEKLGEPEKRYK